MRNEAKVGLLATGLTLAGGFASTKLAKAKPAETTLEAEMGYGGEAETGFGGGSLPALTKQFNPGDTVKATMKMTNTGSVTAKNVTGYVTIKNPDGTTWLERGYSPGDIPPGESRTHSWTAKVQQTGTYTQSGEVIADNADTVPISGDAFEVTTAKTTIKISSLWTPEDKYTQGDTVEFLVQVANTGDVPAKNVNAVAAIREPDGTVWLSQSPSWPQINPGETKGHYVSKKVTSDDPLGTYTEEAAANADNAPSTKIPKRKSFEVVKSGTTMQAGMGYSKVSAGMPTVEGRVL